MKRLILLCDGTWDRGTRKSPTNVAKLHEALDDSGEDRDGNRVPQQCKYLDGVGATAIDWLPGGIFGVGISDKIKTGYRWLCENYEQGDEIFLFGFSRGAFTARSCAGLIRNCGILRRERIDQVDAAYRVYRKSGAENAPDGHAAQRFRAANSLEVRIRFIGVWDTVGALGIPGVPKILAKGWWGFHDLKLSRTVDFAFHALSIDERRRPFRPAPWESQPQPKSSASETTGAQTLRQVWFAGCHGDVGGGRPDPSLSEIPLMWMIAQAQRATGLGIKADRFRLGSTPTLDAGRLQGEVICPAIDAPFTDSRTLIYKLLPPYVRPMIDRSGTARYFASRSATNRQRIQRVAYDPPNLAAFEQIGGQQMDVPYDDRVVPG